MPTPEPYTTFDVILDEHELFQPALTRATTAAERLVRDPTSRSARQEARCAAEFIRQHALPHMDYEEAVVFPRAREHGAPEELVTKLTHEHEDLRRLADHVRALLAAESDVTVSPELGDALRAFVLLFEGHVEREEELFAGVPGVRDEPL